MSEQENRLMRCFASVFPALSPAEIRTINSESTANWDSLATVTLASVVQDEFDVEIELDVLPELNSFAAFQAYLQRIKPGKEASERQ
jgi:acyl carrier protein